MSRYRKFPPRRFDSEYRGLSAPAPSALYLALWWEVGPCSTAIPGVISGAGLAGTAEIIGWPVEECRRCVDELVTRGLAIVDWSARLAFLPHVLKGYELESPNSVLAWRKVFIELPDVELRAVIEREILAFLTSRPKPENWLAPWRTGQTTQALGKGAGKGSGKPSRNGSGKRSANRPENDSTNGYAYQEAGIQEAGSQESADLDIRASADEDCDYGFDEFWNAYPKKAGKKEAREVWTANRLGLTERIEILSGLEDYCQCQRVQDGYVMDPARWLRGRHWEDEHEVTAH